MRTTHKEQSALPRGLAVSVSRSNRCWPMATPRRVRQRVATRAIVSLQRPGNCVDGLHPVSESRHRLAVSGELPIR